MKTPKEKEFCTSPGAGVLSFFNRRAISTNRRTVKWEGPEVLLLLGGYRKFPLENFQILNSLRCILLHLEVQIRIL